MQGIRSDRVPEELWTEIRNIVQEAVIKTIPKKEKCEKAKWLSYIYRRNIINLDMQMTPP